MGVTIPTGTVIYLTPSIGKRWDAGGVLRHELSHATLNQNRSLRSVWRMLGQPWFSEGVAGVIAGMDSAVPRRELVTLPAADFAVRVRSEDLWPCFDAVAQKDWRFSYTAWTFFWDRQIDLRGKETFLKLEAACVSDPDKCRTAFADVYGMDLRKAVEMYQDDLHMQRFIPSDRAVQEPGSN